MCGRFAFYSTIKAINKAINITLVSCDIEPSYNIAPMSETIIITNKRELAKFRWGFVPFFAKDTKFAAKMINARAETLSEKPSFKNAYLKRRCVIPANGFYEWKKDGNSKEPYFIYISDREILMFAGIYEIREDYRSFAIITKEASGDLSEIHNRMPVILRDSAIDTWLDTKTVSTEVLNRIINDQCETTFSYHKASHAVNTIKNNNESLVKPVS